MRSILMFAALMSFAYTSADAQRVDSDTEAEKQRAKIEKLEAKIEKLEAKIEKLEANNEALKNENDSLKAKLANVQKTSTNEKEGAATVRFDGLYRGEVRQVINGLTNNPKRDWLRFFPDGQVLSCGWEEQVEVRPLEIPGPPSTPEHLAEVLVTDNNSIYKGKYTIKGTAIKIEVAATKKTFKKVYEGSIEGDVLHLKIAETDEKDRSDILTFVSIKKSGDINK